MIEIKELSKIYGSFKAVDKLSFSIDKNCVFGFLGPNGAGKSTTMNMITGCLSPTAGEIIINGVSMTENPEEAKKNIEEYFLELRKSWADEKNTTVRISRIEMKVLDVMGIVDIENIKLNGKVGNIVVAEENIPILGTVENT